jgi:hypothetical protein
MALGLRRSGTTSPVVQLITRLEANPAGQFEEKHNIIEYPPGVAEGKCPRRCLSRHQPTPLG